MMWTIHIDGGPRRVNHAAVSVGDKIYSFGGHNSTELYRELDPISVHMLNTSTLRWCKVVYKQSNVPYHRYGHTTVAYGQMVYMWGGRNDSTAFEKLYCFNTDSLEWSLPVVSGSEPLSKDGHSACVIRNKMYIFGGFEYVTNEYSNELHCLNLDTFVWTYFNISNVAPSPRDFHTAIAYGDKMYVFGGRSKPISLNTVDDECYCSHLYCFDTVSQKWLNVDYNIQSPPEGRRSHSAWVYNDYMYIFGGYNGTTRQHFNNLFRYSFRDGTWEKVNNVKGHVPCVRRRQACVLYKDKVYLFGGTSPGPDIGPSTTDSSGVIRDVIEIFNDVIQGDRDVRRLQNHIEMAEDIILPVVNELPLVVRNAIEIDVNEQVQQMPQEGNDNERIHNRLDRFINIRLRINGVIDRLNNQIERNMQNNQPDLNIEHNNRVYRIIRGPPPLALEEFRQFHEDQNPMDADDNEIPDIEELPHFEEFSDPERLYDNNDLHILDYAPTLKTLSALTVLKNKIDQSCLPQSLLNDLQIMTMPNHISKPTDYNEETSQ